MNDQALVKTGIIGAVVAAVCCATPVLVILLGAVGLSALTGYLDYVLLPALALCIGLIGYGLYRQRRSGRTA
jgi:mercuric ion transport protein